MQGIFKSHERRIWNEYDRRTYFLLGTSSQTNEKRNIHYQAKYTKELLKKFEMANVKALGAFMNPSTKLGKDENGKLVDEKRYWSMIGSLLYLTTTRPDIMSSVCLCAIYQFNSKESHLCAMKRIFRYLIGTKNFGLWYLKNSLFWSYGIFRCWFCRL